MHLYLRERGGCFFGGGRSQSVDPGEGPHVVKGSVGLSYHKGMSSSWKFQLFPPHSKGLGDFDTRLHVFDKVVDFDRLTRN